MASKQKVGQINQSKPRFEFVDDANVEFEGSRFYERMTPQSETTTEIKNPGFIRGMGDTALALGQGLVGSVKSISDLAGADNSVSRGLDGASKGLETFKSQESQQARQQHMQAIKAAEDAGDTVGEISAYANMLWDMPAESIAQGIGSFGTLGIGKAAQALNLVRAAKAAGMSKEAFLGTQAGVKALGRAQDIGFKTNLGVGIAQGVGAVKGSQFEQTYQNAISQGMPEDEARALATEAQSYGGEGTAQQILGGGLGYLAAKTGPIEKLVAGKGAGTGGLMRRMGGGFAVEGLTEGLQGGQERFAGNTAAIDAGVLDPSKQWTGVAGQGVSEGIVGGVLGGGAGVIGGQSATVAKTPQDAADKVLSENMVPESGPLARAANAGTVARAQTLAATGVDTMQPLAQDQFDDPIFDQINQIPDEADRLAAERAYKVLSKPKVAKGIADANTLRFNSLLKKHGLGLDAENQGNVQAETVIPDSVIADSVIADQPLVESQIADFEPPTEISPSLDSPGIDLSTKTDEELRAARSNAQSTVIRKAIATELQSRRAAKQIEAPMISEAAPAEAVTVRTGKDSYIGKDGAYISDGAKPFKTRQGAKEAKQGSNTLRIVKVKGGFAVAEKTPAQLAAEEKASARLGVPKVGQRGVPMAAHEFIASNGGLAPKERSDMGVEGNVRIGNRTLFAGAGKGMTIEQAASALTQAGYTQSDDHNEIRDLIKKSLSKPQYTAEGFDTIAERETEARFEDYLAAQEDMATGEDYDPFTDANYAALDEFTIDDLEDTGYSQATPQQKLEVAALASQLQAMGLDAESIIDEANANSNAQTSKEFYAELKPYLEQVIAREAEQRSNRNLRQDVSQQSGAGESTESEGLTAPTRADVLAQQERAAQAEELDQREQVSREASGFTLQAQTQDSRADNTGDMFGGPSVEDYQAAVQKKSSKASAEPDLFGKAESQQQDSAEKLPSGWVKRGDFYQYQANKDSTTTPEQIARALDLTLTRREGSPMVGVPAHAWDISKAKLQEAGLFGEKPSNNPAPEQSAERQKAQADLEAANEHQAMTAKAEPSVMLDTGAASNSKGTSDETRKLDKPSEGSLERALPQEVQTTGGNESTGEATGGSGGANITGDSDTGGAGVQPVGGVGGDTGKLLVPPRGNGSQRGAANKSRANDAKSDQRGDAVLRNDRRANSRGEIAAQRLIPPATFKPTDFTIDEDFALGEGGQKTKYRNNVEAIKLLKQLQAQEGLANADEQAVLAKYVGWGGIAQAFDENNKDWIKEYAELSGLLTESEYADARRSTRYAHYTSKAIIETMYSAMKSFGFTGGKILEPGAGVGNFMGLMPIELRTSSKMTGVEREPIAAGIAKYLYPNQNMQMTDFAEFKAPDGYFDAVIGNPPFAADSLVDKTGRKHLSGFAVHDFFFAKSIDMLRDGGVFAAVVSNGFLDKKGDKARQYIGERAKLLGAIRLPNNAFAKNANTEVTTDIIFLQKLPESEWGSKAAKLDLKRWLDTSLVRDPKGGAAIPINQYFADNPSMMLGEFGRYGTMYTGDQPALIARPGQDTQALLEQAVKKLPKDVYQAVANTNTEKLNRDLIVALKDTTVDEGGYYVDDGKLYQRLNDRAGETSARLVTAETQWTEKTTVGESRLKRLLSLAEIRKTLRQLLSAELANDPAMNQLRSDLNAKYDAYTKEHGLLNDISTAQVFDDDPDYPLLSALEMGYTRGMGPVAAKAAGVKPYKSTAKKAAIFERRVVETRMQVEKAETPADALNISIAERGLIDATYIGKLLGKDGAEVLEEMASGAEPLLFLDPSTGEYELRDAYLSGNVRKKLQVARQNGNEANIRALMKVQPEDVGAHEISAKIGAPWVPASVYEDFVKSLLGSETSVRVKYYAANSSFSTSISGASQAANVLTYGTDRVPASGLFDSILNNRVVRVIDKDSDGNAILNKEETDRAAEKAEDIKSKFQDWLFADPERSELLVRAYNDTNNNYVTRQFDGSGLSFPGKVPDSIIKFRRHQRNAIARIVQDRTALLDHVVGSGKTFTVIAAAMELKRTGLAKKPLIVVPNHLVKQWATDFYRLYPGAKILTATKKDFERANRRRFLAKIATGNWDAVVMAHSSFGFIQPDRDFEIEFNQKQVFQILQSIQEAKSDENEKAAKRTVKQLEAMKERHENRIASLRDKPVDSLLDFKQIGVDQLFVDEAHLFKNLMFSTKMHNVRGLGDAKGSQRAYDMYVKTQQIFDTNGRNQGVVFATGTPVSNSLAEKYHMMRYLMPADMSMAGFSSFDAWANTFAEVRQVWLQKTSGDGYKAVETMSTFSNVWELLKMFDQVADTVTMDDIKKAYALENNGSEFPLPKLKNGRRTPVSLEKSQAQISYMNSVANRALELEKKKGPPKKGEDNFLTIMSDARKAAMDIRLVDSNVKEREKGARIDRSSDEVVKRYNQYNAVKGTQLVFSDLGTPLSSAKKELKEYEALQARIAPLQDDDLAASAALGEESAITKLQDAESAQEELEAKGGDWLSAVQSAIRGFSVYDDMKAALIEKGIPESEIAFIHDYNTDDQKAGLFSKVNAGTIRVVIGSTPKMGAGTNVQERLVALHHLDVPWRPSDIEQREGRIIRQGNKLADTMPDFEVEVLAYVTQDTLDMRMWQTQEVKLKMINQLRTRQISREIENPFEEAEMSAGEMQAAATGNMDLLQEIQMRADLKKLEQRKRSFDAQRNDLLNRKRRAEQSLESLPQRIEGLKAAGGVASEYLQSLNDMEFKASINGVEYTSRTMAETELRRLIDENDAANADKSKDDMQKLSVNFNGKVYGSKTALGEAMNDHAGDRDPILWSFDGVTYNRRSTLAKTIMSIVAESGATDTEKSIGQLGKFEIKIEGNRDRLQLPFFDVSATYEGKVNSTTAGFISGGDARTQADAVIKAADRLVRSLPSSLEYAKIDLSNAKKLAKELESLQMAETWPDQDKLDAKRADHKAVLAKLSGAKDKKEDEVIEDPAFSRVWRSALTDNIETINAKAQPVGAWIAQIQGLVKNGKVKADEVEWTGVNEWLKLQEGKVTKEALTDYLNGNGVRVEEVTQGAPKSISVDEVIKALAAGEPVYATPKNKPNQVATITNDDNELLPYVKKNAGNFVFHRGTFDAAVRRDDTTKYNQYQLPGGENYREVLLTLPRKEIGDTPSGKAAKAIAERMRNAATDEEYESLKEERSKLADLAKIEQGIPYKSSHWDQPNVLAHIRLNDRYDADGNKVLFVEEVQSDWGQDGKKKGFSKPDDQIKPDTPLKAAPWPSNKGVYEVTTLDGKFVINVTSTDVNGGEFGPIDEQSAIVYARKRIAENYQPANLADKPPPAPFVTNTDKWLTLALKRIVTMAVEEGYDKVAFVNGEQSADRYDLSKKVREIEYEKSGDGLWNIRANSIEGDEIFSEDSVNANRIEELAGKEIAAKVVADDGKSAGYPGRKWKELSGLDLKVGGEGMKAFYDKIVPSAAKELVRKLGGGQIEQVSIGLDAPYTVTDVGDGYGVVNRNGASFTQQIPLERANKTAEERNRAEGHSSTQTGFTITDKMREAVSGGVPLFKKEQAAPQGISKQSAQKVVDGITTKWSNAPEIVVVQSMQDDAVPEMVRKHDLRQKSQGATGEPEGFFYKGKAYVVAGALQSDRDVARVLFHEVLGHYGLRGTFGDGLKPILKQLAATRMELVKAKANQYGLDINKESDILQAAEEVLAEMAQARPDIGFVKRAISFIRAWLRKHVPGFQGLKLTDSDIVREFLLPARAYVERGANSDSKGGLAFSRTDSIDPLSILRQTDDLFSMPKSGGKTIAEIIQDHDPEITVKKINIPGNETFYNLTMADGTTARITVRKSGPNSVYGSTTDIDSDSSFESGRPGENPEDVDPYAEDVWIDVSRLKPGQNGIRVYSIASTFAHNTGRIFVGDPNGLSDEAMRRRAENMLSSALKFGTTKHLAPHPRQTVGGVGVPALKWVYGDDIGNIERLIDLNLKALDNANPDAKQLTYDLESGKFTNTRTGQSASRAELLGSYSDKSGGNSRSDMAAKAQAGRRTLARGAVFRAILGRGGAQGKAAGRTGASGSVLAELVRQREKLASPNQDERVFYSRSLGATELAAQVRDKLNETFNHPGKLNWWHKTVGSQYNLAERNPEFKKVFDAAQSFINDVSFYGTEAANNAPKILPKLETLKDLTKTAISAADNKAIAEPIFEGTLSWARDADGKPIRIEALEKQYENLSDSQKERMLLQKGVVSEAQLKVWKGSPLNIYEGAVRNRFNSHFLKAGVVFKPAELKSIFKLNDEQIGLYQEFRAATDASLDNMAKAQMLREAGKDADAVRDLVLNTPDLDTAAKVIRDSLFELAENEEGRADVLTDSADQMLDIAAKMNELKKQGYAPLSRFGRFTVDVVVDGKREYFGLFETEADSNKMAAKMRMEFGTGNVSQGTMNEDEFKLFQGITPESLELFGSMLGLDSTGNKESDKAFQTYLKLTKNNRSAMKRLIHRKGVAGYSEDVGRVLAAFVYSNARQTSAALHIGKMDEAIAAIPRGEGELAKHAMELSKYIKEPREEAAALRGLLFAQYLGGSIASAMVNFTQPLTVSVPYLSQFGGLKKAGAAWANAVNDMRKGAKLESGLERALKEAEESGVVSPQEVHQLMAQARGAATLQSGDGTRRGEAEAALKNGWTRITLAWGKLFGYAEQINRKSTFIAAYRLAVDQNIKDPRAFATKAVNETQFINNKANKMNYGRGAIGATLMTFKSYSLNWLELMHRMSTQNGKEGKVAAAYMLGALFLVAGSGGLPFADDLEDLIDGIGQKMGYNFSSKKSKQEFLENVFGKSGAQFVERGLTGIPGVPIDISGRMGMQNLIPGTGLLLEKRDSTRDVTEVLGPIADLTKRAYQAVGALASGEIGKAIEFAAPRAAANAIKGEDMLDKGMYRDTKGNKVIDTTTGEALAKMIGFQPQSVATVQESSYINQRAKDFYSLKAQEIRAKWAMGIFEGDDSKVKEARQMIEQWNRDNPDQRMTANMPAIIKKVREMKKTKAQRIADTAPRAMRAQMRADLVE